ncbi:MAG: DUF1934 domain-containing protein [Oscillospiraceae bacterium]|nr:DUF1934 domain-containing protein [Oscillospiraceae bacterium]
MKHSNVWISIRGYQVFADDFFEDSMDIVTSGTLSRGPDGITITYAEGDAEGLGHTETTLLLGSQRVTLVRCGDVSTQMVFEPGRKHVSVYETEYGTMTVGVNTTRLHCDIGESGESINLDIEYTLEIDHALTGSNSISIRVSKRDGARRPPVMADPSRPASFGLDGRRLLH